MVFDYFTLREISGYSDFSLKGAILKDIFSQDKDKIVFSFKAEDTSIKSIEFSCSPEFPYLQIRDEFKKARKNSAALMPEALEQVIEGVSLFDNDRILKLTFSSGMYILLSMIPSRFNSLLIENDKIITSFKNSNNLKEVKINDFFRLKTANTRKELRTYKDYLKKNNPYFNNYYIAEVCYRCKLSANETICEEKLELLNKEVKKIYNELEKPVYLKYSINGKTIHSLLELKSIDAKKEEYDSIVSLINNIVTENLQNIYLNRKKNEILKRYEQKFTTLKKKIESIENNIEHNTKSSMFKEYGDAILLNLSVIKKGEGEFKYNFENETRVVKLNKEYTPQQNAEYYYKKYKKQKNSIEELKKKKEILEKIMEKEKKEHNEILETNNLKSIKKMHKEKIDIKEETEKKYFRKFILNESFQVWVGKDSYSNDLLTMRYSSPNDLWFHVRGATGSHTVLKINSKTLVPEKEIIKTAASIAAYYSKARNASNVPVAYCERKYVKKIKGLKQGSVIMEKEKIVNVKPEIPKSENQI